MHCGDMCLTDASKLRQNDVQQLVKFNAYNQDDEENDDDLMNPAMPITSVRTSLSHQSSLVFLAVNRTIISA